MPATDDMPAESQLAAALANVQGELKPVPKSSRGQAGQRVTRYADLAALERQVFPLLGKHGLAFICRPVIDGAQMRLEYSLIHKSGERIEGSYPLVMGGGPQQLGGSITYARRYILGAVTGVVGEDDDDDGQQAQEAHEQANPPMDHPAVLSEQSFRRADANRVQVRDHSGETPWDAEVRHEERPGSADPADLRAIHAVYYGKLGFDERTDALKILHTSEQLVGHALSGPHKGKSHKNLTWHEGKKLRAELEGFKGDRGALLERLSGVTQAAAQDAAESSQEVLS